MQIDAHAAAPRQHARDSLNAVLNAAERRVAQACWVTRYWRTGAHAASVAACDIATRFPPTWYYAAATVAQPRCLEPFVFI